MNDKVENIEISLKLPVEIARAFAFFTGGLNRWWPKEYTWAGKSLELIAMEPKEDGRCFERGPHHFECDWGRVLVWEPPRRVVISWQINPDRVPEPNPEKASEIEVTFIDKSKTETQLSFCHRNFTKHGEKAASYREALKSSGGWPYILENYKQFLS